MSSIQVDVPENVGLVTAEGELFHPDPKLKAEIRFKTVVATDVLPGYRDCSDNEQMIQIEHIITDVKGRRFVFASFLSPYFFWDQMFQVKLVGCSPEYTEFGILLKTNGHRRKVLIDGVGFYRDDRDRRALCCYFPPASQDSDFWEERIFPIYEKHISAKISLILIEWETADIMPLYIAELRDFKIFESTEGKEHGGKEGDKFFYLFSLNNMLWRHFEKPVIRKYGERENLFEGVSFEPISPLIPIMFREMREF